MATVVAGSAGLLLGAMLVWQSSYSAFSDATETPDSTWAAGSVTLIDDDADGAMFTAPPMAPGETTSRCIAVTSTGTVPSTVRLYGTGRSTTNGLASYLHLTIHEGAGAAINGSCSDFTSQGGRPMWSGTLASLPTSFATGTSTWTPNGSAPETRTYRVTSTLDSDTPNSAQGGTAAVTITWEAQS